MSNASVTNAHDDFKSADCKGCGKTDWQLVNSANAGVYLRCRYCNYYIQSNESETNSKARFEAEQIRNYATEALCTTALFDYLSSLRSNKRLQLLKKYLSSGKVIEVGPGAGQMLTQVAASGYEVQGVEHSPSLAQRITDQTGIACLTGEFETLGIAPASYDAFMSFHVIEHVPDVLAHLTTAAAIVKPGGLAIVATPNADSWEHVVPMGLSPHYSSAHLQLFSRMSMRLMLEKSGWQVLELHTPSYAEYWIRVLTALLRRLRSQSGGRGSERGGFAAARDSAGVGRKLALLKAVTCLTWPFRWVQERLMGGSELLVVARRCE